MTASRARIAPPAPFAMLGLAALLAALACAAVLALALGRPEARLPAGDGADRDRGASPWCPTT